MYRIERKDDAAIFGLLQQAGLQERLDVAMHRFYGFIWFQTDLAWKLFALRGDGWRGKIHFGFSNAAVYFSGTTLCSGSNRSLPFIIPLSSITSAPVTVMAYPPESVR